MSKLPFVVQPRLAPIIDTVGSDESGKIQIERRGYLTVGEKNFVQQVQQSDNSTAKILALSRAIAKKKKVSMEKAYNAIVKTLSGEPSEIALDEDYALDLEEIMTSLTNAKLKEDLVIAACMLVNRVSSDFDISTVAELHPDLLQGLVELYRDEERKCIDKLQTGDEKEPSVEELEKKP